MKILSWAFFVFYFLLKILRFLSWIDTLWVRLYELIDGSVELCKLASKVLDMEIEPVNFLDIYFDSEFDGVFATTSLLYLNNEDLVNVLKKISKVLKPSGVLYVSFKRGDGKRQKGENMTKKKFCELCGEIFDLEIFKVIEDSPYDGHQAFINFFLKKVEITK